MKNTLFVFLFVFISLPLFSSEGIVKNLLSGNYTIDSLKTILIPFNEYKPYSTASERHFWETLPDSIQQAYLQKAEQYLDCEWETPKASVFLEFYKNGNRDRYEKIYFARRSKLTTLVIAECIEGKGRFMDDIVNGIWSTCEETFWGFPAHLDMQKKGRGLPDVHEPTVDLFAAETGMVLSWIYYLLDNQLDTIHPEIRKRMYYEVNHRINKPNLYRDDFWWMGLTKDTIHHINNWNPWICSNWLTCVLLLEEDVDFRSRSVYKIMQVVDQYLNILPADGGCDEGPSYWNVAGGTLFDCLELLNGASNGIIQFYNNQLIREAGKYIYRMHIDKDWMVNFADASARSVPEGSLVYRYGKAINDNTMQQFGAYAFTIAGSHNKALRGGIGYFRRILPAFTVLDEIANIPAKAPAVKFHFFPEIQVMICRNNNGFFLATKGGHNDESHNHNDVGNFILFVDGKPVIIDVGVEVYTKKTFSPERYDIWTMQSGYHNVPVINGFSQLAGRQYRTGKFLLDSTEEKITYAMDIARAYPYNASITYWHRTLVVYDDIVEVNDEFQTSYPFKPHRLTFMTDYKPVFTDKGIITIQFEDDPHTRPVFLKYQDDKFNTKIEEITTTDRNLVRSWGNKLYRILLTAKEIELSDNYNVVISRE
jgi:hypothetical protein